MSVHLVTDGQDLILRVVKEGKEVAVGVVPRKDIAGFLAKACKLRDLIEASQNEDGGGRK